MDITSLRPQQLRKAADLKERIDELQAQLNELLGGAAPGATSPGVAKAASRGRNKKRTLSPQAIANIRAGVAKRMARRAGTAGSPSPITNGAPAGSTKKRKLSAAGRRAISLAAKARWAKARAAKKGVQPA